MKHVTLPFAAVFDAPQPIFSPLAEFWETQFLQGLYEKLSCNIQEVAMLRKALIKSGRSSNFDVTERSIICKKSIEQLINSIR